MRDSRSGAWKGPFYVLIWALAWLALINLAISTGWLWSVISGGVSHRREYSLQAQMFSERLPDKVEWLFIGDELFIANARMSYGEQEGRLFIAIPEFSLADLKAVSQAVGRIPIDRVVIQASPYFWTDYWFRAPDLNIDLWRNYGEFRFLHFGRARIFFNELKNYAGAEKTGAESEPSYSRPTSLFATEPSAEPRKGRNYIGHVKNMVGDRMESIYWVRDFEDLPDDAPQSVLDWFDENLGGGFNPAFGNIVSDIADLTAGN